METRFSEERFPMKEISEISSTEKNIRRGGHIATFHLWWARKPLSSSRAMNYAALIPISNKNEEIQNTKDFMIKLSRWENSLDRGLIERASKDILCASGGKIPKVLDPFAGGGSIPLEALRLGCETHASDYNPVATLIQKCILEFPQRYSTKINRKHELVTQEKIQLLEDIRKWGNWVLQQCKTEISRFYPEDKDGSVPVAYIWTRTIPCQNPSCGQDIPLISQYWLSKNSANNIALYPVTSNKKIEFQIINLTTRSKPKGFDPDSGTVSKAIAKCLVCGSVVDGKTTSKLFREKKSGERMIAVVLRKSGRSGKKYKIATREDIRLFDEAKRYLEKKRKQLVKEFGIDPVPDEPTPEGKGRGAERAFSVRSYGMNSWGDLFNARQKLSLITFVEKVRLALDTMLNQKYSLDYAKAIVTYLAMGIDRLADFNSSLCVLNPTGGRGVVHTFGRQVLQMMWTYAESNPFSPFGAGWSTACEKNETCVEHCSKIGSSSGVVIQSSATSLPYPDDYFDAVFTDPPYYDNVPYSHLSDFFYVWLKRSVGNLYPELFSTPLTPKTKEIVAYSNVNGGFEGGKKYFEDMLKKSLQEISRVLKPNGICYIVYAHKSTAGWETLINSLLESGLIVTAAWPINTEMKGRLRARESAALASSIYMVATKYNKKNIGFYRNIKTELRVHLSKELDKLWNEGVSGADFFISAIGSAIEVFARYKRIIDDGENEIRADKLLEEIRRIVIDYAVKKVLRNGFSSEISEMTRLYLLWRWAYGEARIHFDEARKLAQSVGIDLTNNWNKGFIRKDNEFIRLLGPDERNIKSFGDSNEMIDVLHRVLLLWNTGKSKEIIEVLEKTGFGNNDAFYRVAQAISESLPNESKEKKWLEGFLAGRTRITKQMTVDSAQTRLFE